MYDSPVMRVIRIIVLSAFVLLGGSACSFFAPKTQKISLYADQPDALIYVNGREVGKGGCIVDMPRNKDATVSGILGNRRADVVLSRELSMTGIADCCGCFLLFPLSGLLSPGAWQLSQDYVPLHIPTN